MECIVILVFSNILFFNIFKKVEMKLVAIVFVLNVLKQCESSCDVDDKITQLFWTNEHINMIYNYDKSFYNNEDLKYFLQYFRLRTKLKNVLDSKFSELQCDI